MPQVKRIISRADMQKSVNQKGVALYIFLEAFDQLSIKAGNQKVGDITLTLETEEEVSTECLQTSVS